MLADFFYGVAIRKRIELINVRGQMKAEGPEGQGKVFPFLGFGLYQ